MSDKDLLKAIQADDTNEIMLAALRKHLETELEKPEDAFDPERVARITETIDIITGSDRVTAEKTQEGIQKLKTHLVPEKKRLRLRRTKIAAACAALILAVSNIWSYAAYGVNVFSAVYQFSEGSVTIDVRKEHPELYGDNPYEREMRDIYAAHGIDSTTMVPLYLPEGFEPTEVYGKYRENSFSKKLNFFFMRDDAKVNLYIKEFVNYYRVMPADIPSDEHNIAPQQFGDLTVHVQTEEQQFWAVFQVGLTQYILYTDKLDYNESQRILKSIIDSRVSMT
ncbi:MAG: hypothetical protein IJ060_07955 [Oscillospiraceae bacterium]|nr:hypothetical protein [Oscillospiraceae bacterium]